MREYMFVRVHPLRPSVVVAEGRPRLLPEQAAKLARLRERSADSLVTAVRAHRFMWKVDPKTECAHATARGGQVPPGGDGWSSVLNLPLEPLWARRASRQRRAPYSDARSLACALACASTTLTLHCFLRMPSGSSSSSLTARSASPPRCARWCSAVRPSADCSARSGGLNAHLDGAGPAQTLDARCHAFRSPTNLYFLTTVKGLNL